MQSYYTDKKTGAKAGEWVEPRTCRQKSSEFGLSTLLFPGFSARPSLLFLRRVQLAPHGTEGKKMGEDSVALVVKGKADCRLSAAH